MYVGFMLEESPESSFKGETTFMFFVWKEFFTSARFKVHQKRHTGARDHMCFQCEKTCITLERNLTSEIQILPKEQYLSFILAFNFAS